MNIALVSLVAAVMSTLSGPMIEWGGRDITVRLLGMKLAAAEREGRIVMLYHSFAMPVIALLVYLVTANVRMRENWRAYINGTVTAGYLVSMFSGLGYAYLGHDMALHGLWLVGLSLMFFSGVMLAVALWPWNREYNLPRDTHYSHTRSGLDLERTAYWLVAVALLGSAGLGAWAGSHYGTGFETFLAEDIVRSPHKTAFELAVIGHLHIMLALMGIAITLLLGRWFNFRGIWHVLAMPSMVIGTVTLTMGSWSVVPYERTAHTIIYVGSVFALLGGLFLVIFGLGAIIKERLAELGIEKAAAAQKIKALVHDPLRFGVLWQMIYMNFTTSFVGIFMAIKLDEIIRVAPHRDERIELVGHWHILAAIIAILILFYFADRIGLKGIARQLFGWGVIIGSDIAFGAVTVFALKRLFVSEYMQQPVVNTTMLLTDFGLGLVMFLLAAFLFWRLIDLLKSRGQWREELDEDGFEATATDSGKKKPAGRAGMLTIVIFTLLLPGCGQAPISSDAVTRHPASGIDPGSWVKIPRGPFLQGQFNHPVDIDYDYEIMVTEVTNVQYARYLDEAWKEGKVRVSDGKVLGFYPGDVFNGGKHEQRIEARDYPHLDLEDPAARIGFDGKNFGVKPGYENHPVTMVTWFGAKAYADFYRYRLPTDDEWEKAARGTDGRPYPWGGEAGEAYLNYYQSGDPFETDSGFSDTTPVGFYSGKKYGEFQTIDAKSPFGLYDTAGNVGEWTGSLYDQVHYRNIRGSSKASYAIDARVWKTNSAQPEYAGPSTGFRCARDIGRQ